MTSKEQCTDNRFEIIEETKQYIINATNIESSPEEMAVLDSICFRLWQLGLTKRNKDKLKELTQEPTFKECIKEWEDRGWKVEISTSTIKLDYIKFGRLSGIHIYKGLKEVRILYENLHYEEFHLLSKTIKALEEMKDG